MSIYSLGANGYMGLGPTLCADREGRMSGRRAGCLGFREGPDVQAGVSVCPDWRGRS